MNMNHPLRVMLPLAGFCVAFAVMAQTPPNPQGQQPPNAMPQGQQPQAVPPNRAQQATPPNQATTQPNQPSMALGGSNNDDQVNQHKAQLRQQAIQMIEQGLNNLRQSQ
jgi:predicted lipid-binding transport protein (Tim44 family)